MDPDADDPAEVAERASLHSTLMGMLAELDERAGGSVPGSGVTA